MDKKEQWSFGKYVPRSPVVSLKKKRLRMSAMRCGKIKIIVIEVKFPSSNLVNDYVHFEE